MNTCDCELQCLESFCWFQFPALCDWERIVHSLEFLCTFTLQCSLSVGASYLQTFLLTKTRWSKRWLRWTLLKRWTLFLARRRSSFDKRFLLAMVWKWFPEQNVLTQNILRAITDKWIYLYTQLCHRLDLWTLKIMHAISLQPDSVLQLCLARCYGLLCYVTNFGKIPKVSIHTDYYFIRGFG